VSNGFLALLSGARPLLITWCLGRCLQIGLFAVINLHDQPGLAALLGDDETIEDLMKLSPEQILLRWVNYQLRQSGCDRQITNLTHDIKDSVVYIHLINQIAPPEVGIKVNTNALRVRIKVQHRF